MADTPTGPEDACIQVWHAWSGEQIVSLSLATAQPVRELKLLLEEYTDVPAEYQTLLRQDDVVPLCDASTLREELLGPDCVVLFAQQQPKNADLELWELCCGCRCIFGSGEARKRGCDNFYDFKERDCGCETEPFSNLRLVHVQYLLRALPDDTACLQALFERVVLGGGSEAARALAKDLAQDPRVNVNADGCNCDRTQPTLLETAAQRGKVDMCKVLIASGKLQVEPEKTRWRLDFWPIFSEDPNWVWKLESTAERPQDLRDRVASHLEKMAINAKESFILCQIIAQEGLQDDPFCKSYLQEVRGTIADCVEEILSAADYVEAGGKIADYFKEILSAADVEAGADHSGPGVSGTHRQRKQRLTQCEDIPAPRPDRDHHRQGGAGGARKHTDTAKGHAGHGTEEGSSEQKERRAQEAARSAHKRDRDVAVRRARDAKEEAREDMCDQ